MRFITAVALLLLTMNSYSFEDYGLPADEPIEEDIVWIEEILCECEELPGEGSVVLVEEFSLDIDGNGNADALSDGIILLRYLFGLRGEALTEGALGPNATRNFGDIEILLDQYQYAPY